MPTAFGTTRLRVRSSNIAARSGATLEALDEAVVGLALGLRHEIGRDDVEDVGEVRREAEPLRDLLRMLPRAVGEDVLLARQPEQRLPERRIGLHHGMIDVVDEFEELVRIDMVLQHQPAERRAVLSVETLLDALGFVLRRR